MWSSTTEVRLLYWFKIYNLFVLLLNRFHHLFLPHCWYQVVESADLMLLVARGKTFSLKTFKLKHSSSSSSLLSSILFTWSRCMIGIDCGDPSPPLWTVGSEFEYCRASKQCQLKTYNEQWSNFCLHVSLVRITRIRYILLLDKKQFINNRMSWPSWLFF